MRYSINVPKLAARLDDKRIAQGLSIRQTAQAIGVAYTTLYRVLRSNHVPDSENLLLILKWIGVSLEQVTLEEDVTEELAQAHSTNVHSSGESTPESVADILRADEKLTPHDVDMLMAIFRASYNGVLKRNIDQEEDSFQTRMAVTG